MSLISMISSLLCDTLYNESDKDVVGSDARLDCHLLEGRVCSSSFLYL